MADHSGVISANETWTLATSPHNITGAITINDGVVVTIEAGVNVVFQGNYTVTINGAIAGQATAVDEILVSTSTGTTRTTANGNFTLAAVDAGMNFDYWRFKGAGQIVIGATYAGNLNWDYVVMEDHRYAVDIRAPVTIENLLLRRCGDTFGCILTNAADDNVTVSGVLHIDQWTTIGILNAGAPWDISKLVMSNSPDSTRLITNNAGNDAVFDCDQIWCYHNTGYITVSAGSLRLILREGLFTNHETNFISGSGTAGLTAASAFITVDAINNQAAAFSSTVQLINCYIAGCLNALLDNPDTTADAGVVDGTFNTSSSETPAQFANVDAVTGMRSARRNPVSATVNSDNVTDDQVTINFTPNCPCTAELWVSETGAFEGEEYCAASQGDCWVPHFSYERQYYQKGVAGNLVSPPMASGTYYYKLRLIAPWGESALVGDGTDTFVLAGGSGSPTATVKYPVIVVTAAGASAVTTDTLWIKGFHYAAGAASRQVIVRDAAGTDIWSGTSSTKQQNFGTTFEKPMRVNGLKVTTLTGGTLYVYVS